MSIFDQFKIKDKVVVITGGAGLIGRRSCPGGRRNTGTSGYFSGAVGKGERRVLKPLSEGKGGNLCGRHYRQSLSGRYQG